MFPAYISPVSLTPSQYGLPTPLRFPRPSSVSSKTVTIESTNKSENLVTRRVLRLHRGESKWEVKISNLDVPLLAQCWPHEREHANHCLSCSLVPRFIFERQRQERIVITIIIRAAYDYQEHECRQHINQQATSTGGEECALNCASQMVVTRPRFIWY